MTAAKKLNLVSEEAYLASEIDSLVKHEYLGGVVYAMAGGRNRHRRISGNIFGSLYSRLSGAACQPCNSDTKIRVRLPRQTRYYYPDVSVICDPNPEDDVFEDQPRVIFEVISKSTRRIDEGEKMDAYLTIPSLALYVLVEQRTPAVVVFRRMGHGFVREVCEGLDAVLPMAEFGTELPLAAIYAGLPNQPQTRR